MSDLADAVRLGLAGRSKMLPPRFLYDALGSALFDAITELPWYRIPRAEEALLEAHAAGALDEFADPLAVIELGPGSGKKLDLLLERGARDRNIHLHLVDVSQDALTAATKRLARHAGAAIHAHLSAFEEGIVAAAAASRGCRRLVLFLGSNIGNLDAREAMTFLCGIRGVLEPGDGLLLGADLVKGREELLLAYDDPLGVTAAFDLNLLVRINRELGSAFDVRDFAHAALWNEERSRMEMHLVARRELSVPVPGAGITVTMAAGESIHTESSHKYRVEELEALLRRAGFSRRSSWVDADAGFSLGLFLAS